MLFKGSSGVVYMKHIPLGDEPTVHSPQSILILEGHLFHPLGT